MSPEPAAPPAPLRPRRWGVRRARQGAAVIRGFRGAAVRRTRRTGTPVFRGFRGAAVLRGFRGAAVRRTRRTGTAFGPSAYARIPERRGLRRTGCWVAVLLVFIIPVGAGQAQSLLSPEGTYRLAAAAYRAADYARARDLYSSIILEEPRTPFVRDSLFFLAECDLALGNKAQAEKRYRTLLSLYPDSLYREASCFRLADIAWRAGKALQALLALAALQKQFPGGAYSGTALCMAGDIHFAQKDYARALKEYEGAIAGMNEGTEKQAAWYSRGLTQLALEKTGDAEQSFARAAAGSNRGIAEKAGFRRAVLLVEAGKNKEAVLALDGFLMQFPGSAESEKSTALLASLLEKTGDQEGALARWDSLVKAFPASDLMPEYLFRRGEAKLTRGRASAALDDFQAVVKGYPRSPWDPESSYAIGFVYSRRAEYPRALPYFLSAAQSSATGELAERSLLSAGICLFNMGSFDRALARLEDLRNRTPKSIPGSTIAVLIGRTLYRMGRLDDAVIRLGEAAKMRAGDSDVTRAAANGAEAAYWLGWANLRLGRLAEARDAFLFLAREFPGDARRVESLLRAGICETMRAEDADALGLFDQVIGAPRSAVNDDARAQAFYEKGMALGRLGRTQERTDAFERLAAEFPTGRLAPQAFFKVAEQALAEGRYAEAESGFQRVARDYPASTLALQSLYWKAHAVWEAGDPRAALDGFWDCLMHGARAGLLTTATDALRSALRATGDLELARTFSARAAGSRGLAVEAAAGIQLEYAQMLLSSDPEGARAVIEEVRRNAPPEPLAGEAILLQGRYFAAVGDWRRAAVVFNSLESSRTDDIGARAAGEHARVLEATGRTAEAVEAYLAIFSRFRDLPDLAAEGLSNAARVARARGDTGRAAEIEEILRRAFPQSPWVRQPGY